MNDLLISLLSSMQEHTSASLERCNRFSESFGLYLSDEGMRRLEADRSDALKSTGRVEFDGGILDKLVYAFCGCPYITQSCYEETLSELQGLFYYFKTQCRELVSDDELIDAMYLIYNDVSGGSVEYLSGIDWETMYHIARTGSLNESGLLPPLENGDFEDE